VFQYFSIYILSISAFNPTIVSLVDNNQGHGLWNRFDQINISADSL